MFNNISASIRNTEKVALVGRNGAGKSTLFKIIAGYQKPDEGKIIMPSGQTIGYLEQEVNFDNEATVRGEAEKAFAQIKSLEEKISSLEEMLNTQVYADGYDLERATQDLVDSYEQLNIIGGNQQQGELEKVLKGLGFKDEELDMPVKQFSGGWQMRVAMAKLLLSQPNYLLLDEPTNHLDIESILWLESYLKDYEGTVLIISHDKMFMDEICKRVLEVELGNLYDYSGNYSKYLDLRSERVEKMEAAFENQQRVIEQKQKTIDRFMAKATKTKMAQSMQKQLEKMELVEIPAMDNKAWNLQFPKSMRSGEVVVACDDLGKQFDSNKVLSNVNWKLVRGEKVAFVGQNGQGKTTLAKIITGNLAPTEGNVKEGASVQLAYYRQDETKYLDGNKTLLQEMEDAATEDSRSKVRQILGAFLFSGEDVEKKIKVLSGGEKSRLAMAKLLLQPINWLVLDEPTNHLDLPAKDVLKKALKHFDGTLVVVSHDRDFLQGLTEKTYEFRDGTIYEHLGDINYFLEKRSLRHFRELELSSNGDKNSSNTILSRDEKKSLFDEKKKLQRNINYLERDIDELESKLKKLESEMAKPTFFESDKHQEITENYANIKKQISEKNKEWEEAVDTLGVVEGRLD